MLAAVLVPAVVATQHAARLAAADLARYVPSTPGSTWVFDTRTNGKGTGRLIERISGPAQVEALQPDTFAVTDHYENFIGSGAPRTVLSYYALEGPRAVRFGVRTDNQYQQATPPELVFRLPFERGASWSWHGKRQGGTGRSSTTVLDVADRQVLGRTLRDCLNLRVTSHDTGSQGTTSSDVTETWQCPTVGVTELHEVYRSGGQTIRFDEALTEVHVPGLNLRKRGTAALTSTRVPAGGTVAVDAGHSGFVPGAHLSTDHLAWSIARRNEILYPPVGSGDDLILAEDDGTVSSTNAKTGRVDWQVGLSGPIVASPVVAGGLVLVADATKSLWALDAADGTTRWVTRLPDVVSSAPAVVGQTLVVPTDDLSLRGMHLATGAATWRDTTAALVVEPPVVADGLVVVGDQVGNLTAVRASDGSTAWSDSSITTFSGGSSALGGLAAGGNTVVASTDSSTVFAYDASTGHLRWRAQSSSTVDRPVAIAGDRVAIASDSSAEVLDAGTGDLVWRRRTDTSFAPPLVLGSTVAVLQTNNRLALFDIGTGSERTVPIRVADPHSEQSTRLPMSWAAGALVVPTHELGSWPFTILQAFPAGEGGSRPALGVRPAGRPYVFGSVPEGPPSLVGDTLYVTGTAQLGGKTVTQLSAVRPRGSRSSARSLYRSTATLAYSLVAGDRVVTQAGTHIVGVPTSGGRPWVARGSTLLPGTSPVVAGDTLIVPDPQTGLSGIDIRTGRPAWPAIPLPGQGGFGSPVVLADGRVAWGAGRLTVIDPRSGKVVAQRTGVSSTATLAEDAGRLFGFVSAGKQPVLAGFDATTLDPTWAVPFTPAAQFGLLALAPSAGDGVVVAVDSANVVRAFDESDGTELWTLPLRMMPNTPPVVWRHRVYVEEPGLPEDLDQHEHRVTVLDARTGAFEGQWEPAGVSFFTGAFALSGGRLLIPQSNGLLAIGPEGR